MVTPVYNPSLALIPQGWPYSDSQGSGQMGNAASHQPQQDADQSSADAAKIKTAQGQNSAGTSARVI